MASSKLTARRETVKKPPVCHTRPVPPIVPPPPGWPPQSFDLHFLTDYTWDGTPYHYEYDAHLVRDGETWNWKYLRPPPPPFADAYWFVSFSEHTADLHLRADNDPIIIIAKKYDIEVMWGQPRDYHFTSWDELYPNDQDAVADFSF